MRQFLLIGEDHQKRTGQSVHKLTLKGVIATIGLEQLTDNDVDALARADAYVSPLRIPPYTIVRVENTNV